MLPKRLLKEKSISILKSANLSSSVSSNARKLLIEHSNEFVSKSTYHRMINCEPSIFSAKKGSGRSSASDLVNWLRKEATGNQNLRYKILSHRSDSKLSFHSHSKGRPKKRLKPTKN